MTLHAPSRQLAPVLLCAGPRKSTTPAIPGPGQIREPRVLCLVPRSRDLTVLLAKPLAHVLSCKQL